MALINMIFQLTILLFTSQIVLMAYSFTPNHTLTIQLIHRDSIFSPLYNPNFSISDSWNNEIKGSRARVEYLTMMRNRSSMSNYEVTSALIPRGGIIFLMKIFIGRPRVPQYFIMDTGSDLLWVRSTLCTYCRIDFKNIYNPARSSSFRKVQCYTPECTSFQRDTKCNAKEVNPPCEFGVEYMDEMSIFGNLALERFTFVTPDGDLQIVPNITFGYATRISQDNMAGIHGIVGLQATNPYTLVSLFGRKFSYCFGNIRNTKYSYNQLSLGSGAVLQGYSTLARLHYDGSHLVTIEGISLGQKQLEIDEDEFEFNVLIDSGTSISYLKESGYESIVEEVDNLMTGTLDPVDVGNGEQCYQGNMDRDLHGFPLLTFHFSEGAHFDVGVEGMFHPFNESIFCLAIDRSDGNVIGVLAQQFYNVGFDFDANRIYFQNIDCDALES